ncbi:hypothetical protein B0A50_01616 [Salinomyces thailandicus]|uniref:Uncharacterized protein n=1 Tax=Salinomyces thailandicus TaxID=706561 RepID=A0A4U0UB12_9PEZI|nr:hypothetical protein B0A50_01616 [Salinomyces thailandica]
MQHALKHKLTLVQNSMASASVESTGAPSTPRKAVGFRAPQPTTPFDETRDDDPWELFPELDYPNSALRDDTRSYQAQIVAALVAEKAMAKNERRPNSTIDLAARQELAQRRLRCGPFEYLRIPTRPRGQASVPSESTDEQAHQDEPLSLSPVRGSPMKVDTPSYKPGLRREQETKPKVGD